MTAPVDGERTEAVLVEHYPRLVRLGYLVLPPGLGRTRRVLAAHTLAGRALPPQRGRQEPGSERPSRSGPKLAGPAPGDPADADPDYAYVRLRVLRMALAACRPLRRLSLALPLSPPYVWGLRLFPHSGGADELALEQALSALTGPGRAAHVLRGLEGMTDCGVRRALASAGVADPGAALAEADAVTAPYALLAAPGFDPCALQVRPPDLRRRAQRGRAAVTGVAALLVCGALVGLPEHGWGRGAGAPAHGTLSLSAERALDPAALLRVPAAYWRRSARTDFTSWPTRGDRTTDTALLRRALTAWGHPDAPLRASATPGTPVGPPVAAPQLLYAGGVGRAAVVLFHDGLRVVRYEEDRGPGPAARAGAVLDFARVDSADLASAGALVVGRGRAGVRYLTAPWVRSVAVRRLPVPGSAPRPLHRAADGVTAPLAGTAPDTGCRVFDALELRDGTSTRLMADLGELTPARLTSGPPSAPHDVSGRAERESWARTACLLPEMRARGVRSVNSWRYAEQTLPEGEGSAQWLCTRAETWRGEGSRVLAQFQAPVPASATASPGAVAARAEDSPACGRRAPRVLAGVLWRSGGGRWYVLAAGSGGFTSLTTSGGVEGRSNGRLLAVPARAGDRARLNGLLSDGSRVRALR